MSRWRTDFPAGLPLAMRNFPRRFFVTRRFYQPKGREAPVRFGSVRLRFGGGTVRAVPVFGSGGSSV